MILTEPIGCLGRTRKEKGKDKVGDEVPPILVATSLSAISEATEESAESPLSSIVASRTEFETAEICLEEGIKLD